MTLVDLLTWSLVVFVGLLVLDVLVLGLWTVHLALVRRRRRLRERAVVPRNVVLLEPGRTRSRRSHRAVRTTRRLP